MFEPHDNTKMYEAHIPQAILSYNVTSGKFRRKTLEDTTSMVMAPMDILQPDFNVSCNSKLCQIYRTFKYDRHHYQKKKEKQIFVLYNYVLGYPSRCPFIYINFQHDIAGMPEWIWSNLLAK